MADQKQRLYAPLVIGELQEAVGAFPNCKAPREDVLPMEFYKQYPELLLPRLLRVFNESLELGALPPSMSKAHIILHLKAGKDPVDQGFYRPILLLQCDVKILAKVLGVRLNEVVNCAPRPGRLYAKKVNCKGLAVARCHKGL